METFAHIKNAFIEKIKKVKDLTELKQVEVEYLGKKEFCRVFIGKLKKFQKAIERVW